MLILLDMLRQRLLRITDWSSAHLGKGGRRREEGGGRREEGTKTPDVGEGRRKGTEDRERFN